MERERFEQRGKLCVTFRKAAVFGLVLTVLLIILVWDMKKAHQLSSIIHNDYVGHWRQMNDTALKQWYSPLDLCMLNADSPELDLAAYRAKNCSKMVGQSQVEKLHLYCNVGSSITGKKCPPPITSRTFFTAHLKDSLLGDPHNNLLKKTLRELAQQHKPIIFVGDGLSKQNAEALLCEAMRSEGGSVVVGGHVNAVEANYTLQWRRSPLSLSVSYLRLTSLYEKRDRRHRKMTHRHLQHRHLQQRHLQNSTVHPNPMAAEPSEDNTTEGIFNSASLTLSEVQARVTAVLAQNRGIVLVVNVGVWYNSRAKFRTEVPDLLTWMNTLSKERNSTVFFRETAAQHWNHTDSGYYDSLQTGPKSNGTCRQIEDATPEFDWRNQ
ncbi:hypothetical protein B484DRAFT_455267, partial [Ochromonadaceae sp. CCMP2298]